MQAVAAGRPWIEQVVASPRVRATYASTVAHVLVLLILGLLAMPADSDRPPTVISLKLAESPAVTTDERGVELGGGAAPAGGQSAASAAGTGAPEVVEKTTLPPVAAPVTPAPAAGAEDTPPVAVTERAAPSQATPNTVPSQSSDRAAAATRPTAGRGDAFAGRRDAGRGAGVAGRGGSAASEAGVGRGLEWLARHQATDGSWRFDLSGCRCDGACRQPGTATSTTAATAIALLPFLGAGQTHEEGVHRETVTRGLYYLMSRMRTTPRGGDLSEGTMYGQGVATLALAEALGMTGDRMLAAYVRDGVRFIETAQDLHGGGWRYLPGQPGDTTVTAWQLAALKSAALAGVAVPSPTLDGVCRFLDRMQVRGGEGYGYLAPQDRPCTSAIGLLCRVYTGWEQEDTIDRGLTRLAKPGPDREAVYQNFYLSQALLLRNHPAWPRWNRRNRDQLVTRQATTGHEAGSWSFADPDTAPGGRLGHTALAILTLEVYYRLLPIYSTDAADVRW